MNDHKVLCPGSHSFNIYKSFVMVGNMLSTPLHLLLDYRAACASLYGQKYPLCSMSPSLYYNLIYSTHRNNNNKKLTPKSSMQEELLFVSAGWTSFLNGLLPWWDRMAYYVQIRDHSTHAQHSSESLSSSRKVSHGGKHLAEDVVDVSNNFCTVILGHILQNILLDGGRVSHPSLLCAFHSIVYRQNTNFICYCSISF